MEDMNFLPIIVAALIPTITGMIWYHEKVFGAAWMKSLGKTKEQIEEGMNMPVIMIVSLIGSFCISFMTNALIEIMHYGRTEAGEIVESTHTFGHGAFHGFFFVLLLVAPVLIMNGLYERKSWRNILIHVGYWMLTISLMTGLTDAWN